MSTYISIETSINELNLKLNEHPDGNKIKFCVNRNFTNEVYDPKKTYILTLNPENSMINNHKNISNIMSISPLIFKPTKTKTTSLLTSNQKHELEYIIYSKGLRKFDRLGQEIYYSLTNDNNKGGYIERSDVNLAFLLNGYKFYIKDDIYIYFYATERKPTDKEIRQFQMEHNIIT